MRRTTLGQMEKIVPRKCCYGFKIILILSVHDSVVHDRRSRSEQNNVHFYAMNRQTVAMIYCLTFTIFHTFNYYYWIYFYFIDELTTVQYDKENSYNSPENERAV